MKRRRIRYYKLIAVSAILILCMKTGALRSFENATLVS
jgi:hypothetical protein